MSSSKNSSFHKNSSDWHCSDPDCANLNFARRMECNRCKKPREVPNNSKGHVEIGQLAAKSSRGLFSADDWSCTKCGNINWARRNQCNICNAKKFVDEEARTGLGGGFNERVKVEYKQRRSSDSDEFDEFGRRKKYAKKSSNASGNSKKSKLDRYSSSSDSSSRSRSRKRNTSSSSSSSSSSTSSSSSSHSHAQKRLRSNSLKSRSKSPKRLKIRSKSRSRSTDRLDNENNKEDNNENERLEEKRRKKSPSQSSNASSSSEEGDLSKYNLFDDDDLDIQAFRTKKSY